MRLMIRLAIPVVLMLEVLSPARAGSEADCPVFVLRRDGSGLAVERSEVPEGEMRVFLSSPSTGILSVILPPGPGTSGSLIQSDEKVVHLVRCDGGTVRHELRDTAGQELVRFPERALDDLRRYNIRVSVKGPDKAGSVFLIKSYQSVAGEPGPVQNLLAQAGLPRGENDFVLTTETYLQQEGEPAYGTFQVELKGHPFARIKRHDGQEVWFLIDIGAAETLVEKSFLPQGVRIEESRMVEYSRAGRRLMDYAPGGATGTVAGILGHARLPYLQLGAVRFTGVSMAVMEEMPDLFDRPISGIIGLDLLRRPERLVMEFPPEADGRGSFSLVPSADPDAERAYLGEAPFTIVNSHLVVPAQVNNSDFYFILDSGAPKVLLDDTSAELASVPVPSSPEGKLGGLDTNKVLSYLGNIQRLQVGGVVLESVSCSVAPLAAFASLKGQDQPVGLLGNSFFGRFRQVEIDFVARRLLLVGLDGVPDAEPSGEIAGLFPRN